MGEITHQPIFLSRTRSEVDLRVNNEAEHFERHVYQTQHNPDIRSRIETNQGEDVITSSAINQLEDSNEIIDGQFKDQLGMVMRESLLCRGRKVVVPGSMRQDIISLLHCEGHPGVDKTTRLVRSQFYWKRMNSDIEQFCRGCLITRISPRNNLKKS